MHLVRIKFVCSQYKIQINLRRKVERFNLTCKVTQIKNKLIKCSTACKKWFHPKKNPTSGVSNLIIHSRL